MKRLHRPDLYAWSSFDEGRDIDFNGVAWIRPDGNVLVDPLPMSGHDRAHLEALGGAALIVVTNSDHVRGSGARRRNARARDGSGATTRASARAAWSAPRPR